MHSDKTKEGLSLYGEDPQPLLQLLQKTDSSALGILNHTKTTLGRALLRMWLLRPSLNLSVIRERHDALDCFTRSDNITTANTMHGHLKGIKNMPKILKALESGKAKLSDWQGIVKVNTLMMCVLAE